MYAYMYMYNIGNVGKTASIVGMLTVFESYMYNVFSTNQLLVNVSHKKSVKKHSHFVKKKNWSKKFLSGNILKMCIIFVYFLLN